MNNMDTDHLENVARCYICAAGEARLLMPVHDRWFGTDGEFNLYECRGCGLIYTNPRPGPEFMAAYYPDTYGPHQAGSYRPGKKTSFPLFRWLKPYFNTRSSYLPPLIPGGRLLELGCSYGSFLAHAKNLGWAVHGVEIAAEPVQFGRQVLGLDIRHGTLESAAFPEQFFDVVTGWMVLEHLHDPVGTLEEIRRVLKPGGLIAFGIPNAACWEFKLFGPNWFALEIPRHLSHFTSQSISTLFAKTGFELVKVYYQKNISNIPASMALFMEDRFGPGRVSGRLRSMAGSGLFNRLAYPLAAVLSWVGMTGRITVVGKLPAGNQL